MSTITTKTISAQNTFTDAVQINGWFNLSVSGTFSATVTAQRSTDGENWVDIDSWTTPVETVGMDPELMYYRVGVKTGGFTSGSIVVRLGADDGLAEAFRTAARRTLTVSSPN